MEIMEQYRFSENFSVNFELLILFSIPLKICYKYVSSTFMRLDINALHRSSNYIFVIK